MLLSDYTLTKKNSTQFEEVLVREFILIKKVMEGLSEELSLARS